MTDVIADMVDRMIAHAQTDAGRAALTIGRPRGRRSTRILADLEARSLGHPSLGRLRRYIAQGDEAWNADQRRDKMTLARRRISENAGFPGGRRRIAPRRDRDSLSAVP